MTKAQAAKTGNGYDPRLVESLIKRLEECDATRLSEHGVYMERCQEIKGDIDNIFEEAQARGVPRKALKAVHNARKLERKAEAAREKLDADLQDSFDLIRHALGDLADTELGKSALAAKAKGLPGADSPGSYN